MKQILIVAVAVLFTTIGFSQEEKNIVYDANVEVRQVQNFNGLEVSGAIDVYISQGNEEAVAVSGGDAEAIDRIKTEVKNGVLHIYFDGKGINWKSWNNNKLKAYVTFKNVEKLMASGACNLIATQTIKVNTLLIDLSGASDFKGAVNVSTLAIDISGAANVKISGSATQAKLQSSGASDIKGYDLTIDYCKAETSGASSIRIRVNKELAAEASGASNVYYKGEAVIKAVSSSGGSTIKRQND
jgi:hypothetical protein